jgi:DNA modification methylase
LEKWLNQIHQGDCLELIKGLPDNSIDMVFTDPPYGHNNNNNGDLISRWESALGVGGYCESMNRPIANDGAEANELFKQILPELKRVMKPGSCCCC